MAKRTIADKRDEIVGIIDKIMEKPSSGTLLLVGAIDGRATLIASGDAQQMANDITMIMRDNENFKEIFGVAVKTFIIGEYVAEEKDKGTILNSCSLCPNNVICPLVGEPEEKQCPIRV